MSDYDDEHSRNGQDDHGHQDPVPPGRRPHRPVEEPPPKPKENPDPPIEDPRPDQPKKMRTLCQTRDDLPDSIRQSLTEDIQDVYVAAFRRTWEKCVMSGEQRENWLAATANYAALLAVRRQLKQAQQDSWLRRSIDRGSAAAQAPRSRPQ